jgi:hypothetical protein
MAMKRALLLGLGAMIFGGCSNGADDSEPTADRWGKSCYYSYGGESSTSYTARSSDKGGASSSAQTDEGFRLTMKADTASFDIEEMVQLMTELRFNAAVNAVHFHEQSCMEEDQTAYACKETCGQNGLHWDEEAVVCETCKVHDDGTIECPEAPDGLHQALAEPWFGDQPWVFHNEKDQLAVVMHPPKLEEDNKGELVWVAEVDVHGFCLCACAG